MKNMKNRLNTFAENLSKLPDLERLLAKVFVYSV